MSVNNKKNSEGKSEITGEEGQGRRKLGCQEQLMIGGECQNKKGGVGGEMHKAFFQTVDRKITQVDLKITLADLKITQVVKS